MLHHRERVVTMVQLSTPFLILIVFTNTYCMVYELNPVNQ